MISVESTESTEFVKYFFIKTVSLEPTTSCAREIKSLEMIPQRHGDTGNREDI